jgi:hypothetical protein
MQAAAEVLGEDLHAILPLVVNLGGKIHEIRYVYGQRVDAGYGAQPLELIHLAHVQLFGLTTPGAAGKDL